MRVASFNVNGIRARLQILTDWLAAAQPDVVCLQETKVQDHDFPLSALQDKAYSVAYQGQKSYNGVAVLTKEPLEDICIGFGDGRFGDEARMIRGRLGAIHIVNTYVPQGQDVASERFTHKLDWLDGLGEEFRKHLCPDDHVLWMGDLNIARDDRDVYDPIAYQGQVCFHPDEHAALNRIMDWGFEDVFRRHVPEGEQYSFFDYRIPNGFKRNLGWRVDHIMASKPLADLSRRAWIDKEPRALDKPSDHTPICAEFDI